MSSSAAQYDIERPETLLDNNDVEQIYTLPLEQQYAYQLAGLKKRFAEQVDQIAIVKKLADEQGVTAIERIEDAAPLLLQHSVYKSYPLSIIEKGQFGRLTRWLDNLSAHDLSGLDASSCSCIDDWIDLLDDNTDIRVIHSTGTSGKLSFLPRSVIEVDSMVRGWKMIFDRFQDDPPRVSTPVEQLPVIYLAYRAGAMAHHRLLDGIARIYYNGDSSNIFTLNSGRLSADAVSLGGRLKAAEAKGERGMLQIAPSLMARREAFLKEQEEAPRRMDTFFDAMNARLRGNSVCIMGSVPQLYDAAVEGQKRGIDNLFDPVSFVMAGGGNKGRVLPSGWRKEVTRFLGVPKLDDGYGMSEVVASMRACPNGNYHLFPFVVPFVLDPKSGAPAPRTGTQTGRLGVFDLNARSYWGGFLTGDKVTVTFGDQPCGCGRVGTYVHPGVTRFTEAEGGDDKITCAGAPDAHDNAVDFILNNSL
ncbi:MAG: hypothetical protein WC997_00350 [Porticoccaceae bacterium]